MGDPGIVRVSPHFKYAFFGVLGLTLITFAVSIWVSLAVGHPDSNVNNLIITTDTMYKIGFGGIVGLLGGRAATL
jgi:hypothetical protein